MPLSYDMQPAISTTRRIETGMSQSPRLMQTAGEREIRRFRPLILKDMALAKRQSPLPFIWSEDSPAQERARAWYFANKVPKGSRGGRYQRTGQTEKATKVTGSFKRTGGMITLSNNSPGGEFVFGFRQVPSHTASGHPLMAKVAEKWQPLISRRYEEIFITLFEPFAGIPQ